MVLAIVLVSVGLFAQASPFSEACDTHQFMGAVSVKFKGKTVFEAACGFANAEWGVRNTVDTKFRTASIAKQFTAVAVLLLRQEGKVDLAASIGSFVDDLPLEWRSATVHQLLTHTSGIPSFTGGPIAQFDRMGATPRELLGIVKGKPLQFPHGTRLAYNNTGYVLLGMLIEKVSGVAYPDFVERRIFAPLQMKDSGFDNARVVLPRRANGYKLTPSGLVNADRVHSSVAWSAGGFYSTTRDLITWASALRGPGILLQESLDLMFRVYPETLLQGMHYGYAVVIAERAGTRLHYHGGGIGGFHATLQTYPDRDLIIAVMSNLDSDGTTIQSWTIADQLAALYLSKR